MPIDCFVIALKAGILYEEEVAKRLGIDPYSEYGAQQLRNYLDEERKNDEDFARISLGTTNQGKYVSYNEIMNEASKISEERLQPYVEKATREYQERKEETKKALVKRQKHS